MPHQLPSTCHTLQAVTHYSTSNNTTLGISFFRAVKLAYSCFQASEESKGLPLLIIHGLFGSKNNWQSLAKTISRSAGIKVTAICFMQINLS